MGLVLVFASGKETLRETRAHVIIFRVPKILGKLPNSRESAIPMSDFVQQLFDTLHIDVAEETSSIVIVGMETMKQLKQNLKVAESFTPMSDEKRLAFFKDIIHLVEPAKVFWKATDWDNPTEWIPRNRGKA